MKSFTYFSMCNKAWPNGRPFADDTSHYNDVIMSTMASQITSITIVYSTVYSWRRSREISTFISRKKYQYIYNNWTLFEHAICQIPTITSNLIQYSLGGFHEGSQCGNTCHWRPSANPPCDIHEKQIIERYITHPNPRRSSTSYDISSASLKMRFGSTCYHKTLWCWKWNIPD